MSNMLKYSLWIFCHSEGIVNRNGIMANCGQSYLFIAIHGCFHQDSARYATNGYEWLWLMMIDDDWPRLTMNGYKWLWITMILYHDWPRTMPILLGMATNDDEWWRLTMTDDDWRRLTMIGDNWPQLTTIHYEWWWLATNHNLVWLALTGHVVIGYRSTVILNLYSFERRQLWVHIDAVFVNTI